MKSSTLPEPAMDLLKKRIVHESTCWLCLWSTDEVDEHGQNLGYMNCDTGRDLYFRCIDAIRAGQPQVIAHTP